MQWIADTGSEPISTSSWRVTGPAQPGETGNPSVCWTAPIWWSGVSCSRVWSLSEATVDQDTPF